jgi:predicted AAA+ superfamily ATPase
MDARFLIHNTHLEEPARFLDLDPQLRRLRRVPLVYQSPLLEALPADRPGISTLTGGRQTGKSTLVKQWMARLLTKGVPPAAIHYVSGELIDDHHALVRLLVDVLAESPSLPRRFLAVDEVTYIKGWDRGLKYLADGGLLDEVALLVTGSDSVLIREAVATLPGRRGTARTADFRMRPLSFKETADLKKAVTGEEAASLLDPDRPPEPALAARLMDLFAAYLAHGGYLTAINDMAAHGRIGAATLATYSDWIRGDVLKRGKHETTLREVLQAVLRRSCSQVTWNALARELSVEHPATAASYVLLLESMDVLNVQAALAEHRLGPAPKKARRVGFADPFIRHAISAWLAAGHGDPDAAVIRPALADPVALSQLAEECAVSHHARHFPTYYIKGDRGEIDIAFVSGGHFHPREVKWTGQIRPHDLRQAARVAGTIILDRSPVSRTVAGLPTLPLPVALFRLG